MLTPAPPLSVVRSPSPGVRLVAPPRQGDRDLERDAEKLLDELEGRYETPNRAGRYESESVGNGGNSLRPSMRGGEVGIRSSLKAHITLDIFNNVKQGLEDPRDL